ncbi:MAG: hypothetical protein C5B59_07865 [Bacteroidetes bacterium]|nr:MAG: hypothetical protein C5B59_07865 [Bacteroidota bacterium]
MLLYLVSFPAGKNPIKDSTVVTIKLDNVTHHKSKKPSIDSVYLIFDKYDHSGAGIVKQMFYPSNNLVTLTVPSGKYFVNIVCMGTYNRVYFDYILIAKSRKGKTLSIKLQDPSLFTPGLVDLPQEKIDFSNLLVTHFHRSR